MVAAGLSAAAAYCCGLLPWLILRTERVGLIDGEGAVIRT